MAEGILVDLVEIVHRHLPSGMLEGAVQGFAPAGGGQLSPASGIDDDVSGGAAAIGIAACRLRGRDVHRLVADHQQPQGLQGPLHAGTAQRLSRWQQLLAAAAQRRQMLQALVLGELGVAHVHHHHAGDEPQQEEQGTQHPQPAVAQQQQALGAALHAQKASFSHTSAMRGEPSTAMLSSTYSACTVLPTL